MPLFLCSIDHNKAFDSVLHGKLWSIMLQMDFPGHIVRLISLLCTYIVVKKLLTVRIANQETNWLKIRIGVKQGYFISTLNRR